MSHQVEYTNEFETWWNGLTVREQGDVAKVVELLVARGTALGSPQSSQVKSSRHRHMRELRSQSGGRPMRVFYAFDPRRTAILLIGGRKLDQERFYRTYVQQADALYGRFLRQLRREGLLEPEGRSER